MPKSKAWPSDGVDYGTHKKGGAAKGKYGSRSVGDPGEGRRACEYHGMDMKGEKKGGGKRKKGY